MSHFLSVLGRVFARHRERLVDVVGLVLILQAPHALAGIQRIPWAPQLLLLAVCLVIAPFHAYAVPDPWRRYRRLLPSYLLTSLLGFVGLRFWFGIDLAQAALPVAWLVGTAVWRLPLETWSRKAWQALAECGYVQPTGEALILVCFTWMVPRWVQQRGPEIWLAVLIGILWCCARRYRLPKPIESWGPAILAAIWGAAWLPSTPVVLAAAGIFSVWLAAAIWLSRAATRRRTGTDAMAGPAETVRWIGLILLVVLVFHPFYQAGVHGTGDAHYYATVMADAITQFRSGVFPVFVGQSEFQFNGSVMPIRVAPAFQYAGGLLDLATARTLNPMAVQNALIVLIAIVGAFSAYAAAQMLGLRPAAAWVAAMLYLFCPGIVGLAFNSDLYMSWMVVPLVPMAFALGLGLFMRVRPQSFALLGAVVGAGWWCHAPIALWLTFVMSMLVAWQVVGTSQRDWRSRVRAVLAYGGSFLAVSAYPLCSVAFFPTDPTLGAAGGFVIPAQHIVQQLEISFPAAWLVVSELGRRPADFQLGWALLALGLAYAPFAWRKGGHDGKALVLFAAVFLLLLLPIPWLSQFFWETIPATVRAITNVWPMQRFHSLLAMIIVGIVASAARAGAPLSRIGLTVVCLWTLTEAWKFPMGSWKTVTPLSASPDLLAPENITLSRYAYGLFRTRSPYFTHGVTDAALENRLLADDLQSEVAGNYKEAGVQGRPSQSIGFTVRESHVESTMPIVLQPGRKYLATIATQGPPPKGTLVLQGTILQRVYALPEYGDSKSFGLTEGRNPWFPLSTSGVQREQVRVLLEPESRDGLSALAGRLTLVVNEYDPKDLPIQVASWIPFRAIVRAETDAWLETPRSFQPGYVATVDGRPIDVRRTAAGLVAVAVPAGQHEVVLRYLAPTGLQAAFWLSGAALALTGFALAGLILRSNDQDRAEAGSPAGPFR